MRDSAPASFSTRMESMWRIRIPLPKSLRDLPPEGGARRKMIPRARQARIPLRGRPRPWGGPADATAARRRSQLLREDHLRQPLSARDHRKHVLRLVGDEVHEHEPVLEPQGFLQRALDVARFLDLQADMTI